MANTYGIEVALRVIEKEIKDVFAVYGNEAYFDPSCGGVRLTADLTAASLHRDRGGPTPSLSRGRLHVL